MVCDTLSFADALALVHLRVGELMQNAFPSGYGLAVIEGLNEDAVEAIVKRVRTVDFPVYVSNINAPRQIVVAGSDAALDAVIAQANQKGVRRAERLSVSVPSHCPLLQPVADPTCTRSGRQSQLSTAVDALREQSRRTLPI